jgi:Ca2+-binding EF-hand superfamily protein
MRSGVATNTADVTTTVVDPQRAASTSHGGPSPSPRSSLEHHEDPSMTDVPLLVSSSALNISSGNTITTAMSNNFTEQETRYFRKMFDMFDTDHSGAIGYFEMKNLARHLGVQISDEQLLRSIERVDDNGNGELEFDEFMQWLSNVNDNSNGEGDEFAVLKSKIRAQGARPLTSSQIEQFREVFHHFDMDGSGTIDMEELGNVFEAMGQTLTTEELQSVLKHADDDGSGEIDFDEFLMLMCCSFGAEKSFESDLLETFRRYDVDADGLISARDLRQLVVELVGDTMTAAEVDEVVEVAAVERGDGYIEYLKWESLWDACRGVV